MKMLTTLVCASVLLTACAGVPVKKEDPLRQYVKKNSVAELKQSKEDKYAQKLSELNGRNPVQDAQRAIARRQHYLLAYQSGRGGAVKAPGLSKSQTANTRCSFKRLDGFGDVIYGKSHLQYRVALRRYASQFNTQMKGYCQ